MAEVPKRYFQRFFVLGGVAFVGLLFFAAFWVYNINKLNKAEEAVYSVFKEFKINTSSVYLPSIRVAGPSGGIIDLNDNSGKYTVLNIWATWCAPCVTELLSLRKLNKTFTYDSEWRIIAVSIDLPKNLPKVAKYTAKYKVENIANFQDYNLELQKAIKVDRLPMTLILNKSGRILYEIHGDAFWHDKKVTDFLVLIPKVY